VRSLRVNGGIGRQIPEKDPKGKKGREGGTEGGREGRREGRSEGRREGGRFEIADGRLPQYESRPKTPCLPPSLPTALVME
jgi:hypothetical protein